MVRMSELDVNRQNAVAAAIQYGVQNGLFKTTERKRSMAYFCYGPDVRKSVPNKSEQPIFYFVDASGNKSAEQAQYELFNSPDGGSYVFYDNSPFNNENLTRKLVKCKQGGTMIPWSQLFYTGSSRKFCAMYDKSRFGALCNNKQGGFLVCALDNNGNLAPEFGVEVISGEAFAKKYTLSSFPNLIHNVEIDIARPDDLFERLTSDDLLTATDIGAFTDKLSVGHTCATSAPLPDESGWIVVIARTDSPCILRMTFKKEERTLLESGAVSNFEFINGLSGGSLNSQTAMEKLPDQYKRIRDGKFEGFIVNSLLGLFKSPETAQG